MAEFFAKIIGQLKTASWWIIGGIVAIITIFWVGHHDGEQAEIIKTEKETLDHVEEKQQIDASVDKLNESNVTKQLRDKWSRK